MFGRMFCTTLSLAEKLSGKIRHKHVSELLVIIVEKLPHGSMNHLCSWLSWKKRTQYPAILTFTTASGGGEQNMGDMQTKEDRRAHTKSESPVCWSSAGLSKEPPTDMCNQPHPHVFLSHSLPLWLMSPPDSIEAIRQ